MKHNQICSILSCGNKVNARGFCNAHYMRWWRHGDPLAGGTMYGAPHQWMLDHVNHTGQNCLLWPFSSGPSGYGTIKHNEKSVAANNYMCRLAHGEPPRGKICALHSCRGALRGCVNPLHLRWGSHSDNSMDMIADGTILRGENSWNSRLTENDVLEIRNRLYEGELQALIAEDYEVSQGAISSINTGKSWSWLT